VKQLPTIRLLAAAVAMVAGAASAQATDATMLADRAGFLVGHALRCGVAEIRLKGSATLIGELIDAYAIDGDDRKAAQSAFMERVVSSVAAKVPDEPMPSCAAVRTQLTRFERHRWVAAHSARPRHGQANAAQTARSAARGGTTPAAGRDEPGPLVASLLVR
jgi:hypothetical protein